MMSFPCYCTLAKNNPTSWQANQFTHLPSGNQNAIFSHYFLFCFIYGSSGEGNFSRLWHQKLFRPSAFQTAYHQSRPSLPSRILPNGATYRHRVGCRSSNKVCRFKRSFTKGTAQTVHALLTQEEAKARHSEAPAASNTDLERESIFDRRH